MKFASGVASWNLNRTGKLGQASRYTVFKFIQGICLLVVCTYPSIANLLEMYHVTKVALLLKMQHYVHSWKDSVHSAQVDDERIRNSF